MNGNVRVYLEQATTTGVNASEGVTGTMRVSHGRECTIFESIPDASLLDAANGRDHESRILEATGHD